jgi:hypothetical protein
MDDSIRQQVIQATLNTHKKPQMPKFCSSCGNRLSEAYKFCPACGNAAEGEIITGLSESAGAAPERASSALPAGKKTLLDPLTQVFENKSLDTDEEDELVDSLREDVVSEMDTNLLKKVLSGLR